MSGCWSRRSRMLSTRKFCAWPASWPPPEFRSPDAMLAGILSGKTRVLDLAYAINGRLVPWPGDERWFEAKTNASVEKDGYFTRSFGCWSITGRTWTRPFISHLEKYRLTRFQ